MCHRLVLLTIYSLLVSIILRCYYSLLGAQSIISPFSLNSRRLRAILDCRGIIYPGVVEKRELAELTAASGPVYDDGDGECVESDEDVETQTFTGAAHFYEQVEDCKDSAWLVQVLASGSGPILTTPSWRLLLSQLSSFGIRTGTFDCRLDSYLCSERGWNTSRLLLALPYSERSKSSVALHIYPGQYRPAKIQRWVYQQLATRVQQLHTSHQLAAWISQTCAVREVCVLLVSSLTLPPVFFSALGVKFTGRARFGITKGTTATGASLEDEEKEEGLNEQHLVTRDASLDQSAVTGSATRQGSGDQHNSTDQTSLTQRSLGRWQRALSRIGHGSEYLLLSPQRHVFYGHRHGERVNFKAVHAFLRWVCPDMNDLFVFSLAVVNMCAIMSLFEFRAGSPLTHLLRFAWALVKYNVALLLAWIILLTLSQFSTAARVGASIMSLVRRVSLTNVALLLRADWSLLMSRPRWLISSYLAFCTAIGWIRRRWWPFPMSNEMEGLGGQTWSDWLASYGRGRMAADGVLTNEEREILRFLRGISSTNVYISTDGGGFASSEALQYLARLPVWRFDAHSAEQSGPSTEKTPLRGDPCFRCRLVRAMKLRRMANRLVSVPCGKCGYRGQGVADGIGGNVWSVELSSLHPVMDAGNSSDSFDAGLVATQLSLYGDCRICLESYQEGDELCGLPCDHSYHRKCILPWLMSGHHVCPLCRWPAYRTKEKTYQ